MKTSSFLKMIIIVIAMSGHVETVKAGWAWPWQAGDYREQAIKARQEQNESSQKAKWEIRTISCLFILSMVGAFRYIQYLRAHRTLVNQIIKKEVVNRVVRKVIIYRTPAHEVDGNHIVVDGLNVIYGHTDKHKMNLMHLMALVQDLLQSNRRFKCYFDANTFFALEQVNKSQAYAFRRLAYDYPDIFTEVPGGVKADDYVLDYAHREGAVIISNDRYRDFVDKYSWLNTDKNRRFSYINDFRHIEVIQLGLRAEIPKNLGEVEREIRELLDKSVMRQAEVAHSGPKEDRLEPIA